MKIQLKKSPLISLFFTISVSANAETREDWVNQQLNKFYSNPRTFMKDQRNVRKFDPDTFEEVNVPIHFSEESIRDGTFVLEKDFFEKTSKEDRRLQGRQEYFSNDRPDQLVDEFRVTTLLEMERSGLKTSTLPSQPWSGDYWPIYTGVIAKRYADPRFPYAKIWRRNRDYILTSPTQVEHFSPAEKYDALLADPNWTLTRTMANEGHRYTDGIGFVETWMGICHGWAAASFMVPRPTTVINLLSADGKTWIPFYPTDIKALSSLLWAKGAPTSRFIGGRCKEVRPAEDAHGRIVSQNCFDTNPGTWHLSVVNQIGVSQRSFIFDSSYDYQVWNQPAYSYQYTYFNPATRQAVEKLQDAVIPLRDYRSDPFRRYRSKKSRYVAGISMKFTYIGETLPIHDEFDNPLKDKRIGVNYLYDLELDEDFKIIGGEWYQRQHPDFLWVPPRGSRAVSVGDTYMDRNAMSYEEWNVSNPIPASWRSIAVKYSGAGLPLARIVDTLVSLSKQ